MFIVSTILFIQQIFVDHLLSVGHCSRLGYNSEKRQSPCLPGAYNCFVITYYSTRVTPQTGSHTTQNQEGVERLEKLTSKPDLLQEDSDGSSSVLSTEAFT